MRPGGGGRLRGAAATLSGGTQSSFTASLVTTADLPRTPKGNSLVLILALALGAGLAAGVGVAFARDLASDRLRGRDDLAAQSGLPVVGEIPHTRTSRFPGLRARPRADQIVRNAPLSTTAEAYRFLRARLESACGGTLQGKVITVTSPRDGAGRTTTAANLAAVVVRPDAGGGRGRRPRLARAWPGRSGPRGTGWPR